MECQKSWCFYEELLLESISFFNICLFNFIHSENIMYSAEELLPKYFFPKWVCGYDNIMHHSYLTSVTFWIMAVSKAEI